MIVNHRQSWYKKDDENDQSLLESFIEGNLAEYEENHRYYEENLSKNTRKLLINLVELLVQKGQITPKDLTTILPVYCREIVSFSEGTEL